MPTKPALIVAACLLSLSIAGCGGDGGETAAVEAGPSRSETADGGPVTAPGSPVAGTARPTAPGRIPPPTPEPGEIVDDGIPRHDPGKLAQAQARVEASPDDVEARRRLGIELVRARRHDEAIEQFKHAVELDPGRRTLLDLGLAYGAAARLDDAEATYQRLLGIVPGDPVALHNLGNLALRKRDTDEAIARYQAALEQKPDYLLAKYHLGDALRLAGRYEDAYRIYEQVLEMDAQAPPEVKAFDDALYQLAALDLTMGAPQRAAQLLAELLRNNSEHANAYYAMGQALTQLGHPEQAQQAFDAHMRVLEQQQPSGTMASSD